MKNFKQFIAETNELLQSSRLNRKSLTSSDKEKGLSDRQRYAITSYSGSQYDIINKAMRKPDKNKKMLSYAQSLSRDITSGMKPIDSDMTVYRGVKSAKHVVDSSPTFSSTSLSPTTARNFAGESGHVMKIRLKKGTPVAYTDNVGEREVILPKGKFQTVKKTKAGKMTYHKMNFEND